MAQELRIGSAAPNLMGQDAVTGNRRNLYRRMTEMRFKRDGKGHLVVNSRGKYASMDVGGVTITFSEAMDETLLTTLSFAVVETIGTETIGTSIRN